MDEPHGDDDTVASGDTPTVQSVGSAQNGWLRVGVAGDDHARGAGAYLRAHSIDIGDLCSAMALRRFHYSFLVRDLEATRRFYVDVIGCREGRSTSSWIDFDMFGNQLSCHLGEPVPTANVGRVDGIVVPMPHFGAIVTFPEYEQLAARVTSAGVSFIVPPRIRYAGEVGEQGTCFFLDPSGNAIEIKAFSRDDEVFAR